MSPERIAHYQVVGKLGEGSMGEVYRATDTKLGRDVALKVVPESLALAPDRMARFAREAQVLAALNHPNIAAIYGVEERALVMELVEGHTLAERLARGAMLPGEAIPIIEQIIDALEYAHDKGIVHRDLKPANIKITPEGRVKVLDFGLAKALAAESEPDGLSVDATMSGVIIGTAAYMAPEQARGQNVDRRADIWAFGVLVWEMVSGGRLFAAASGSDTLANVLTRDVEIDAAPPQFRRLLRLCLARDVRQRLRDISGARLLLEEPPAPEVRIVTRRSRTAWVVATIFAIAAGGFGGAFWRARPAPRELVRLNVDLGAEAVPSDYLTAAISPDGRRIAYVVRGPNGKLQLATRRLEAPAPAVLTGTEDASVPFFSPDGEWIGFFAAGKLKKVSVLGGSAVTLCDAPYQRGGTWGPDGYIVFSPSIYGGLSRVSENGGTPEELTRMPAKGEVSHRWPQYLPGGQFVLFSGHSEAAGWDAASIEALDLRTREWRTIFKGGYFPRYTPGGHLLYVSRGMLFAVRFDPARLETIGSPAPVVQDVGSNPISGAGQFDFSQTGTFVYRRGKPQGQDSQFSWATETGKTDPLLTVPGTNFDPRLSPDGKRLALAGLNGLMVYDIERQTPSTLVPPGSLTARPLWAPDGQHLVYIEGSSGSINRIWWIRADGSSPPFAFMSPHASQTPYSFSPDGKLLALASEDPQTHLDIWIVPLDLTDPEQPKAGSPESFLRTPANEQLPAFSPDGHWIAYVSDEGGTQEVYVRPYPAGAGKWQVSAGGGKYPVWSRAGRQLFFESPDNHIMVAEWWAKGEEFVPGQARAWMESRLASTGAASNYDVAPDGQRLVVMPETETEEVNGSVHVMFLMNFFEELRRRVK